MGSRPKYSAADIPMDGQQVQMTIESPPSERSRPWFLPVLAVVSLAVIIIAILVGLILSRNPNSEAAAAAPAGIGEVPTPTPPPESTSIPTAPPTLTSPASLPAQPSHPPMNIFDISTQPYSASPTPSPVDPIMARVTPIKEFLISNGFSDDQLLSDTQSPQYRATLHLAEAVSLQIPTDATSKAKREDFKSRWVLMVLYYAMGGPNWYLDWNIGNHDLTVCNWNGFAQIQTYYTSGGAFCTGDLTIGALELNGNNLTGTIPTEIGLLTDLDFLSFVENDLSGTLPTEMQSMTRMVQFIIRANDLSGSIPSWLSKMTKLEALTFSNNFFNGTIPDEIYDLTSLLIFAVDDNDLTGSLEELNSLTNLFALYAEDNDFSDTLGSSSFASLTKLIHLDLSNNDLEGSFPSHLLSFPNLTVIDLHGNFLGQELPEFPVNNMLRTLSLHQNDFFGTIPSSITNLHALEHLDLTSLDLDGTMPEQLGDLSNLEYLFLAGNDFIPGPIPTTYQNLTHLRDFSIKGTQRTGPTPQWLQHMDSMILLDLDANQFVGEIPSVIGDMAKLQFLLMNRNQLTGSIPFALSGISDTLRFATFDHNDLSGDVTALCLALPNTAITADCNGTSLICPCCTICCLPDDDTCVSNDLLAVYDPIWQSGYQRLNYYFDHHNITDDRRLRSGQTIVNYLRGRGKASRILMRTHSPNV